ncbi:hypothetical protein F0562_023769 [Nyssa sinensis]|uniref:SWIM-type domain-containing protein n=1 Tax=Nyssa sinensis TaxID=561372 RepID=A0A5J5BLC9_9ASTE|nr:hypothetical protein F0562_023769 [Nyssa sinensis]
MNDVEYDLGTDDSSSSEDGSVGKSTTRVFDQNLYEKKFNVEEGSKTCVEECTILFAGGMEFEVKDGQGVTFVVDLDCKKYVCRACLIGGFPCKHSTAVIGYKKGNIKDYYDDAFSKDKYLAAHKHILHPIADPNMWRVEAIAGDPITASTSLAITWPT